MSDMSNAETETQDAHGQAVDVPAAEEHQHEHEEQKNQMPTIQSILEMSDEEVDEMVKNRQVPESLQNKSLLDCVEAALQASGYCDCRKTAEILLISYLAKRNVVLFGEKGFGKSEISEFVLRAVSGRMPFVKSLSPDTDVDEMFGGADIAKINDPHNPVVQMNFDRCFGNFEEVIFEECFDAPAHVLAALKDAITSKMFRNGSQIETVKTKVIVICTNLSPEEYQSLYAESQATKAILDRFPLSRRVGWSRPNRENLQKILRLKNTAKGVTQDQLEEIRALTRVAEATVRIRGLNEDEQNLLALALEDLAKQDFSLSPRMITWIVPPILVASRTLYGRREVGAEDYLNLTMVTEMEKIKLSTVEKLEQQQRELLLDDREAACQSFIVAEVNKIVREGEALLAKAKSWIDTPAEEFSPESNKPHVLSLMDELGQFLSDCLATAEAIEKIPERDSEVSRSRDVTSVTHSRQRIQDTIDSLRTMRQEMANRVSRAASEPRRSPESPLAEGENPYTNYLSEVMKENA